MPKLIIMNAGTEQMLGHNLTHPQKLQVARAAWRNAWFAKENDIIVMPVPMKSNFLDYIGNIFGFDSTSINIITLADSIDSDVILTDEKLLSADIIKKLEPHIPRFDSWTIMACYYSAGVVELASTLGINAPAGKDFAEQRGVDLLNRKSQFRRLAAGAHLPLANGSVAYDASTLAKAITQHLPQTGTVIIKQDNNVCGMGNLAVTREKPKPLPGVCNAYQIEGDNISNIANDIWKTLSNHWSQELVVESYHVASHMLYVEYFIPENGYPYFLNHGLVRLQADSNPNAKELLWIGLEIPAKLPFYAAASILTESMKFAMLAAQIGYRGYIDIDAIVTDKEEVIINEVNARWGGCSILHTLAEQLLGNNYGNKYALCSRRNIKAPPLEEVLSILKNNNIDFDDEKKEGVLVLACDEIFTHTIECMIIGCTHVRVSEIENFLLDLLKQ